MHSCAFWMMLVALLLAVSRGHVVRKRAVESGQHEHKEKEQVSLLFLQPTWFSTMFDSFNSVAGVARANQQAGEESTSDVDVAVDVQQESNDEEGTKTDANKRTDVGTDKDTNIDPANISTNINVAPHKEINVDLETDSGVNVNVDVDSRSDQSDALPSPDVSASVDVGITPLNLDVDVKADVDTNFGLNVINDLIGAIAQPDAAINEIVNPLAESTAIPNRDSLAIDEASTVEQERIERNVADFLPLSNSFSSFNGPHTVGRIDGQWRPESMRVPTVYHQGIRHPVYESQYRFDPHRVSPPRFYPNFMNNEGPYWRPGHSRGQGGIPNRH